jgi:hypothetical protein
MSPGKGSTSLSVSSSSTCGVALFLLGLNIGLSFLLIFLVAGHLKPANFEEENKEYIPGHVQNMLFLRRGSRPDARTYTAAINSSSTTSTDTQEADISHSPCNSSSVLKADSERTAMDESSSSSSSSSLILGSSSSSSERKTPTSPQGSSSQSSSVSSSIGLEVADESPTRWSETVLSSRRKEAEASCRVGKCKVYYVHIHKSGGKSEPPIES